MSFKQKGKLILEDEDLDDLDDVLSQFNPMTRPKADEEPQSPLSPLTSPPPPPPSATTASFNRRRTNTRVDAPPTSLPGSGPPLQTTSEADEDELNVDFARELAKGMEDLMKELGAGAGIAENDDEDEGTRQERQKAFDAAWEAMLVEEMNGIGQGSESMGTSLGDAGVRPKNEKGGESGEKDPFQKTVRQALDKLKEGESKLKEDTSVPSGSADSLEALLASLGDLGLGEGAETDEEFAGFLENMMGQLMSKEVLYEPLKELSDKFPSYLANPPTPLSAEDKQRYELQLTCVQKIIAVFDDPAYDEKNAETSQKVIDLMSEMQTHGSPPSEITGPLPPGFDSMEGCVIS